MIREELHKTKMLTKLIKRNVNPTRIKRAVKALERAQEDATEEPKRVPEAPRRAF
jgi:hypothetical protein